jgi:hypothetical protein
MNTTKAEQLLERVAKTKYQKFKKFIASFYSETLDIAFNTTFISQSTPTAKSFGSIFPIIVM